MAKKQESAKPTAVAVKVKVDVESSSATPMYYANYAEIAHTQHDFVLSVIRVPAKFSAARRAELEKSKVITLEPEVQITLPPTLIRPLIEALEKQLAAYEAELPPKKGTTDRK